jgi:hypothetical protein
MIISEDDSDPTEANSAQTDGLARIVEEDPMVHNVALPIIVQIKPLHLD